MYFFFSGKRILKRSTKDAKDSGTKLFPLLLWLNRIEDIHNILHIVLVNEIHSPLYIYTANRFPKGVVRVNRNNAKTCIAPLKRDIAKKSAVFYFIRRMKLDFFFNLWQW